MTRIIAGQAGGRRLRTPSGSRTRPTSDRVREALFSALDSHLGTLAGCRFLDMYAGSGAVGLEAASRGAIHVTLVERDAATAALAQANARQLGLGNVSVVAAAAQAVASTAPVGGAFDVVFLDPPYATASGDVRSLLVSLRQASWLEPGALVVVERARRDDHFTWPPGLEPVRCKRYGETMLWYGRVAEQDPGLAKLEEA